jgi:hypothetical protein
MQNQPMDETSHLTDWHPDPQDEWWGFHPTLGWVLLDRKWDANQWSFTFPVPLVFVQGSTWRLFSDTYDNWRPPSNNYSYAPRHLERFDASQRAEQEREWMQLVGAYQDRREDLARRGFNLRQGLVIKAFCERTGRNPEGVRWFRADRNSDPCWNCTNRFNGNVHLTCVRCAWLICCDCNACRCGWTGR